MVDAPGAVLATNLERVKTFVRPDFLALNAGTQLEPGSVLILLRSKDQFSEVDTGATNTVWVLRAQLTEDGQEVEAAKLINRARLLQQRNDPDAQTAIELAKTHFGLTRLVQTLLMPTTPALDPNAGGAALDANAPGAEAPGVGIGVLPPGIPGHPRVDGPAVPH